jgi:hypothetical protein
MSSPAHTVESDDGEESRESSSPTSSPTIAITQSPKIDPQSEASRSTLPPSHFQHLSTELLHHIISHILYVEDAQSFALSTRRHYHTVLSHFHVPRLDQIPLAPRPHLFGMPPELLHRIVRDLDRQSALNFAATSYAGYFIIVAARGGRSRFGQMHPVGY